MKQMKRTNAPRSRFSVLCRRAIPSVLVLAAIALLILFPAGTLFQSVDTSTRHYVPAVVREVCEEELSPSELDASLCLGYQRIRAQMGDETVELENYLTPTHSIPVKTGDRVILCADTPEQAAPYYTLYNYDRSGAMLLVVLIFLAIMVGVGGLRGCKAALAIAFSLALLFRYTLPAIYQGGGVIGVGQLTVFLSTAATVLLLYDFTVQALLSGGVTLLGEGVACGLFTLFCALLHLDGFQFDQAESLIVVAQNTGLELKHLLFASTMIAALGAVMDVAVSLLSALWELKTAQPTLSAGQLFSSGMNIGRDMIGTMSNTLIFAFAGGALGTMLVLYSYGVQAAQLLNSNFLAIELAQGLCSTAAVILTVPLACATAAAVYPKIKIPMQNRLHIK